MMGRLRIHVWIMGTCGMLVVTGNLFAQAHPSYEAEVRANGAFALSGPGIGYYPTSSLAVGQKVTVYGERTESWLAILPPEGSFSWVPAKAVEEQTDGTGVIKENRTKVRVGSSLTDAHHVWQVELKKGDKVQILDQMYLRDPGSVENWYKILSPTDEVRYVAESNLKLPGAGKGIPAPPSSNTASNPAGAIQNAGGPMAASAPLPTVGTRMIQPAKPIGGSSVTQQALSEVTYKQQTTPDKGPPVQIVDDPAQPFDKRLQSLRTQVELMRSRDPSLWDIEGAKKVGEQLRAAATGVEQKKEILDLLAKIDRYGQLQRQRNNILREADQTRQRDEELAMLQKRKQSELRGLSARFTAEGVLQQAALRVDGQTAYSLQDGKGLATHYVIAPPGLNLAPYLGLRVGLVGEESQRRDIPVPVLSVQQLTPLQAKFE